MSPTALSPVRLGVTPDPSHVRVVRLVTVSLARLTGLPEEGLDDVRLATSEAVGRAVAAHRSNGLDDLVEIEVSMGKMLQVRVHDRVPLLAAAGQQAVQLLQDAAESDLARRTAAGDDSIPIVSQDDLDTVELNTLELAGVDMPVLPESVSLIAGLADESTVATGPDGTVVTMRWRRAG
jgi:hypothetical protein